MLDCAYQVIHCWEQFNEIISKMPRSKDEQWLYRGQNDDWPLMTAIERALIGWRLPLQDGNVIEFQTIREFRRRAREPQHRAVETDTLYCLSLMQHHGAPTRLLDCTDKRVAQELWKMAQEYQAEAAKLGRMPNLGKPPEGLED